MAVLFPAPKFQAFSSAGALLVGGLLYTYEANSSTPLATYTDSGGGTENANPVELDARGEANVWLDGSKLYKLVLKTALGVTIWTVDNVGTTAASIRISNSDVSGGVATTLDIFVKRSEKNIVSTFGAPDDGVTNASTFINNALSWAAANKGKLVAPPGMTFICATPLVVPNNEGKGIIFDLQGAKLEYTGIADFWTYAGYSDNLALVNGELLCTGASAGAAVRINRLTTEPMRNHLYENLHVNGFVNGFQVTGGQVIKIKGGNHTGLAKGTGSAYLFGACNNASIDGVYASTWAQAVYGNGASPLNVSDSVLGTSTYLVRAASGLITLDGVTVEDEAAATAVGIYLDGGYVRGTVQRTSNVTLANLVVTAGTHRGWVISLDGAQYLLGTRVAAYSQTAVSGNVILPFDTRVEDDQNMLNITAGANQGKVTIPITGFYNLISAVTFVATATDQLVTAGFYNGANLIGQEEFFGHSSAAEPVTANLAIDNVWLTAGDVVTVKTDLSADMDLRNANISISPSR